MELGREELRHTEHFVKSEEVVCSFFFANVLILHTVDLALVA